MSESSIIKYGETNENTGTGDTINLNVPLPGSSTGRRIIELSDIDSGSWTQAAYDAGESWDSELGVSQGSDNTWGVGNAVQFTQSWIDMLNGQDSFSGLMPEADDLTEPEVTVAIDDFRSLVVESANEFLGRNPTLIDWPGTVKIPVPVPTNISTFGNTNTNTGTNELQSVLKTSLVSLFNSSTFDIANGYMQVPVATWAGNTTLRYVNFNEASTPRLFIIQVLGISSFLGSYGLGKTVKTFSLLPGEETTISIKTWRTTSEMSTETRTIVDSYDSSTADSFAESVQNETTDTSTQSETSNWNIEGEVSASWGWGKASASGGKSGESAATTEEFAQSINEVVTEHCAEASTSRENSVTSSTETSVETGTETVTERTIKNINVKRTLNFVFRELNQLYQTKIHLKDIRIAFSNGRSGSWREVPLSGLAGLLSEYVNTDSIADIANMILSYIDVVFDYKDQPVKVIERVEMGNCGSTFKSVKDAMPDMQKCYYEAPPTSMDMYYRFKRDLSSYQEGETHVVDGVLLKQSDQVLRTDSVIIEALLGTVDAVDDYAAGLQLAAVKEKDLANKREELAQQIVSSKDTAAAAIYEQVFLTVDEEEE